MLLSNFILQTWNTRCYLGPDYETIQQVTISRRWSDNSNIDLQSYHFILEVLKSFISPLV